mmetsp:Transcript_99680/g.257756  ORF Transcript_99680/g.257756 Transcript_99680/m.257756 type:complete len:412 (+) Transcript_99680:116-1351(+)
MHRKIVIGLAVLCVTGCGLLLLNRCLYSTDLIMLGRGESGLTKPIFEGVRSKLMMVGSCGILAAGLAHLQWLRPRCGERMQSLQHVAWVAAIVVAFMAVGPALMILNKHIMQDLDFAYPLTLSNLGLLVSSVCIHILARCGCIDIGTACKELMEPQAWFRKALPVGACKAISLAAGNAAYLFLGLGFIQMFKAFTPAIVVLVTKAAGLSTPSWLSLSFVGLLILGTLLEVKGELHASAVGIGLLLLSEVMEAVNWVITQHLLQDRKLSLTEGLYVLCPPGFLCLSLLAAASEGPQIIQTGNYKIIMEHPWHFLAAGTLGLAVNFTGFALVQVTSTVTMKVLNIVRCIGLVFAGVLIYGEVITATELVGYAISLLGFAGYQWAQIFPESSDRLEERMCFCGGKDRMLFDGSV